MSQPGNQPVNQPGNGPGGEAAGASGRRSVSEAVAHMWYVRTGWAWFGRYANLVRAGEVMETFGGPFARRRAERRRLVCVAEHVAALADR